MPCHVRVRPRAVVRVDLHRAGSLLGMHRRRLDGGQVRLRTQRSCVVKAHRTRGRWHIRRRRASMHAIVRIFRSLLLLPVLGVVITPHRTWIGLVIDGHMIVGLGRLWLAVCMGMMRLRHLLWLLLMLMVVICLPSSLLIRLWKWSERQCVDLRRGSDM